MKKIFLALFATLLLVGCQAPKEIIREVPVEVTHDVYHNIYIHDTTHTVDSTIIYQKGDTIFKEKYKYIYIERQVHDTLATHDTIPEPVYITETTEVVKKEPQWWPVWLALGLIFVYLLVTKTSFIEWIKNFIKYVIKLFV